MQFGTHEMVSNLSRRLCSPVPIKCYLGGKFDNQIKQSARDKNSTKFTQQKGARKHIWAPSTTWAVSFWLKVPGRMAESCKRSKKMGSICKAMSKGLPKENKGCHILAFDLLFADTLTERAEKMPLINKEKGGKKENEPSMMELIVRQISLPYKEVQVVTGWIQ